MGSNRVQCGKFQISFEVWHLFRAGLEGGLLLKLARILLTCSGPVTLNSVGRFKEEQKLGMLV